METLLHMRRFTKTPLNITTALYRRYYNTNQLSTVRFLSRDTTETNNDTTELTRLPSLLAGCDYQHWLVIVEAPNGYPQRDEIVGGYVRTLAMALGSEEAAKESMYSVSTKYYYGFGCKVAEILTHRIKALPSVKWVLPDSYLCQGEDNNYGGEPFVNGELLPYDDKYHMDWIRDRGEESSKSITLEKKSRRRINKNENKKS